MAKKINFKKVFVTSKSDSGVVTINDFQIEIKNTLSLDDFAQFVTNVADSCFTTDDITGETTYAPYFYDVAKSYYTIKYFTNIDVDKVDIKTFWLTFMSDNCQAVLDYIKDVPYYKEAIRSIDELIKHKIELLIKRTPTKFDEVCDSIKNVINKSESFMENLDMTSIKKIADKLNGMSEREIIEIIASKDKGDVNDN